MRFSDKPVSDKSGVTVSIYLSDFVKRFNYMCILMFTSSLYRLHARMLAHSTYTYGFHFIPPAKVYLVHMQCAGHADTSKDNMSLLWLLLPPVFRFSNASYTFAPFLCRYGSFRKPGWRRGLHSAAIACGLPGAFSSTPLRCKRLRARRSKGRPVSCALRHLRPCTREEDSSHR